MEENKGINNRKRPSAKLRTSANIFFGTPMGRKWKAIGILNDIFGTHGIFSVSDS